MSLTALQGSARRHVMAAVIGAAMAGVLSIRGQPAVARNHTGVVLERAVFTVHGKSNSVGVLRSAAVARQLERAGSAGEAHLNTLLAASGAGYIRASDMRSIHDHALMRNDPVEGPVALLPGLGSRIGSVVYLVQAGCLVVQVRGRDSIPPPVRLGVSLGSVYREPVYPVVFDRGDGGWRDIRTFIPAGAGRSTLELTFLNDYFDAATGLDRNAEVSAVRLRVVGTAWCDSVQ